MTALRLGVVANVVGPEGRGRVAITLPDEGPEWIWADVVRPFGAPVGDDPEVDDEVAVGFLDGSRASAVVLGLLRRAAR